MASLFLNYMETVNEPLRRGLIQAITNESIFLRILHFIRVDGFSYNYGAQVGLGTVAFRSLSENYAASVGVVNPVAEKLALFGGRVETDHALVNAQGGIARANAITARAKRCGLFFDANCIRGDSSKTGQAKQFDGLRTRLTGKQVITNATNGGSLSGLEKIDELLDAVAGTNDKKVLVMNKNHRRQLKDLMREEAGGANIADIAGTPSSYDGARIEVLDEDGDIENSPILDYDETCGTSSACSSIYCIRPGGDPDGEYVQGLVGAIGGQSQAMPDGSDVLGGVIEHYVSGMVGSMHVDIIEMHASIAVFQGRAVARLQGIRKA